MGLPVKNFACYDGVQWGKIWIYMIEINFFRISSILPFAQDPREGGIYSSVLEKNLSCSFILA